MIVNALTSENKGAKEDLLNTEGLTEDIWSYVDFRLIFEAL